MTPPTEPEGWVTLPREPSREMWAAMGNALVGYRQRHHDVVAAALWKAVIEAAPPAPPAPRKPLSDEDVERAARAFDAAVAERQGDHDAWVIYETWVASAKGDTERASALTKLADLRAERMDAMRAGLSVLPPVAGGGEVAGLIGHAKGWLQAVAEDHDYSDTGEIIDLITRLVDALEGRL